MSVSPHSERILIRERVLTPPNRYAVFLLNDDVTPMDFVVLILQEVFHKSKMESEMLMMEVHLKGRGLCGIFSYDIASSKAEQVMSIAQEQGYPLRSVIEKEPRT